MEHLPLEFIFAREIALLRHTQTAYSTDKCLRSSDYPLLCLQIQNMHNPHLPSLIPPRTLNHRVKSHSFSNPKAITHVSKILLNLLAHAVLPTPVRIQRETIRVEVRSNVAATSRIRVGEPCTTDIVGLLYQLKVLDAKLAHDLDGETEAGHAGADDEDFSVEGHGSGRFRDVSSWDRSVLIARRKWLKTT